MATKIKPFNLHTSVDTHVKGLIDSAYVQIRQTSTTVDGGIAMAIALG